MPRKSTLINGLGVDLGRCADVQPAGFAIQRANSQPAPIAASESDTCLHAATDLYAATNFYTPATHYDTNFFAACCRARQRTAAHPLDPIRSSAADLIVLAVLSLVWLRQRRLRQAMADRAAQPTEPVKPIAPPPPPTAALEFKDTAGSVVRFALITPSLTLGRSGDNDLIVPDSVPEADTVSQHHAQFRRDQDDYVVRDLNSQNGLTVNGRHTNHNVLQDGDRIAFGAAEAIFRKPSGGAA